MGQKWNDSSDKFQDLNNGLDFQIHQGTWGKIKLSPRSPKWKGLRAEFSPGFPFLIWAHVKAFPTPHCCPLGDVAPLPSVHIRGKACAVPGKTPKLRAQPPWTGGPLSPLNFPSLRYFTFIRKQKLSKTLETLKYKPQKTQLRHQEYRDNTSSMNWIMLPKIHICWPALTPSLTAPGGGSLGGN